MSPHRSPTLLPRGQSDFLAPHMVVVGPPEGLSSRQVTALCRLGIHLREAQVHESRMSIMV
jgi:hypothetical protein